MTRRKVVGKSPFTRRGPKPKSRFDIATLEALAKDLKEERIPLDKVTISDTQVSGLRAIIRKSGAISYHANYTARDGSRPYLKIGDYPKMSINQARQITDTIHALAAKGIDPVEGLHERLMRELLEKGEKWRP